MVALSVLLAGIVRIGLQAGRPAASLSLFTHDTGWPVDMSYAGEESVDLAESCVSGRAQLCSVWQVSESGPEDDEGDDEAC